MSVNMTSGVKVLFLFGHLLCGRAPLKHYLAVLPAQLSSVPHADTAVPRGSGKAQLARVSQIALVWHSAPFSKLGPGRTLQRQTPQDAL